MKTVLVTGGLDSSEAALPFLVEEPDTRVVNLDTLTHAGNLDPLEAVWDNPWSVFVQHGVCGLRTLPAAEHD